MEHHRVAVAAQVRADVLGGEPEYVRTIPVPAREGGQGEEEATTGNGFNVRARLDPGSLVAPLSATPLFPDA